MAQLALQTEPMPQEVSLTTLQPALANNTSNQGLQTLGAPDKLQGGARPTALRRAGAQLENEFLGDPRNAGYDEIFDQCQQKNCPFGFPSLTQETPPTAQQGSNGKNLNLKGAISQLIAMYTRPIEFRLMESFDIFSKRPETDTSKWVPTLQSLGLDPSKNIEHCFFCGMLC
jgi:hypothetical protein